MKILLIFTFFIISGAVRCFDVIGYSGGNVLVDSLKSWCKDCVKSMTKLNPQRNIINYNKHNQWINEGRFTLFCNEKGYLMIFIRDLNTQDSGRYRIGVDGHWYIDMTLNVKEDSCCGASQTVMVKTGETASFSCQYSQEYKSNIKIIYRQGKDSIELIYTHYSWKKKERFSVSDNRYKNLFSVRITDVRSEDAGVYLCGVQLYRDSYSYSIITAVHLNIMSKVGVVTVTGYTAGGIIIKCVQPQYKTNPKYLCKEPDGCSERKFPGVQDQWMDNGDVSLYDDTRAGALMVFFKELKAGDAGTYRCGVNVSHYTESFTEVQLQVQQALTQRLNKSVHLGDDVNITCQIPEEHQVSPKLFCKQDDNHICQTVLTSRVKVNDLPQKSVFTVTISNVTVRDAGLYWCGAETSERNLSFISLTTKVQLNLIISPVFGDEGESAQIICPYDPIYKSNTKYLCKSSTTDRQTLIETVRDQNETKRDRLSLNDDITAAVFTVSISGLTAEDAGKYCCAVRVETDLISLYTDLIIIRNEELILNKSEGENMSIKCKHLTEYQQLFCKAHEPSMCVKDEDSLQPIRDDRFSLSDETSAGVFTVNITDLREEDSGIYWCGSHIITKVHLNVTRDFSMMIIMCVCVILLLIGGFTLIVCKFRHNKTPDPGPAQIYHNAQLPTIPSDLHSPLYSTAQLPTIPSDELLYAAVSFHKTEDSLSDATVTFSKEEILTEYAAVRHHKRLN